MKFKLRKTYLILTVSLMLIEIFIARYVHDAFVRPYLGDVLVVLLLYCFLQSFFMIEPKKAICFVVGFAFLVEFLQYVKIVERIGLQDSALARTVIGTSFSALDLLTYLIGGVIILTFEKYR